MKKIINDYINIYDNSILIKDISKKIEYIKTEFPNSDNFSIKVDRGFYTEDCDLQIHFTREETDEECEKRLKESEELNQLMKELREFNPKRR